MVAAVRVHKTGGPEVLQYEQIEIGAPGQGQVKVKQHAAGVNYIDTYFRMGMYPSPVGLPFVSGNEAAGDVIAVGPGVADLKVGDRVAYVHAMGAYAEEKLLPADRAVKLPDNISYEQAAAMMLKGMTAEYLLRRTFKVQKGDNILVNAAAGGVGSDPGASGARRWAPPWRSAPSGQTEDKGKLAKRISNGRRPHHLLPQGGVCRARVKEDHQGRIVRGGLP